LRTFADRTAPYSTIVRRLFRPTPMTRIGLFFLAEAAGPVVSVLARLGACELDRAPTELKEYLRPCFPEEFRQAVRHLRERYEPLATRWGLTGEVDPASGEPRVPTVAQLREVADALEPLHEQAVKTDRRLKELRRRQSELEHVVYQVRALAGLGIDVAALADLRFLHLKAGTVPAENVERLRESAELGDDIVLNLGGRGGRAHVLVVGAGGMSADLEGLLAKAHFEPAEMGAWSAPRDPAQIEANIEQEAATIRAAVDELEAQDRTFRDAARPKLAQAARALAQAAVFVECDGAMEGRQPVAYLGGWVPQDRVAEIQEALGHGVDTPVILVRESGRGDAGASGPPTEVAVPAIFRPGATLVSLYGLPRHDELDPTFILAATTPLFFGMMFGDVGQGLLLGALAVALRRRLGRWVAPAVSWSLGSVIFGLLYGSVFGVEHWLPALWMRPLDDPFRLLGVALAIGVIFLLLTFVLSGANLALRGRWLEALFGFRGAAGASVYAGGVLLLRALYLGQPLSRVGLGLLGAGIGLTAAHAASEIRTSGRGVLGTLATEYFHGILGLFTGTLSFLRLAAFALNHGALSLALFLVVDMFPASGPWLAVRVLVLVIGSIFILVLDVLVVTVQTIRLEFYEGLTRYYRGDGRAYQPLRFARATTT